MKVKILPFENEEFREEIKYENGDNDGSIATPCGCTAETTGKPDDVVATQYHGRITLSWTDRSVCETGFAITRDDRGFSSDYNFAAAIECGERHAPQTIFDDLTSQPSDPGLYESDPRANFAWPDGSNYAQQHADTLRWPKTPISLTAVPTVSACLLAAVEAGSDVNALARKNATGTAYECALFRSTSDLSDTEISAVMLMRYTWNEGVTGKYIIGGSEATCQAQCNALDYAECEGTITDNLGCALVQTLKEIGSSAARFSPDAIVKRRLHSMSVGSAHSYCVAAINPVGYGTLGYVSDQVS